MSFPVLSLRVNGARRYGWLGAQDDGHQQDKRQDALYIVKYRRDNRMLLLADVRNFPILYLLALPLAVLLLANGCASLAFASLRFNACKASAQNQDISPIKTPLHLFMLPNHIVESILHATHILAILFPLEPVFGS